MHENQHIGSIVWLLQRANGATAKQIFRGSYDVIFSPDDSNKYMKIMVNRINEAKDLGYINTPNSDNWNFFNDPWTITKHGKKFISDNVNNKYSYSESVDNWYLGYKSV